VKTKIIANPVAGKGKVKKYLPVIQEKLKKEKITYDLSLSSNPDHVEILARQAKEEGYKRIVACGGDGTVNKIINAIVKTDISLGIIPLGTGNDLARNMGIKEDIEFACNVLKSGKTKKIDVIKVKGDKYYGGVGGVGFDVDIVFFVNRWKKFVPGVLVYPLYIGAIIKEIVSCNSQRVKIIYDDKSFSGQILMACFGNTESYARKVKISPFALPNDGLLDICIVKKVNKLKIMRAFLRVFLKTKPFHLPEVIIYNEIPGVEIHRAKKVYLESKIPLYFHGDAEIISTTPLSLEVIPEALKVVVPPSS